MEPSLSAGDFYLLEDEWTAEQRGVAERVRAFIDAEVMPYAGEWHERAVFPRELIPRIAGLDLLDRLAHNAIDPISYGLAMRELERGSSALRSLMSVQGGLVIFPIMAFGSDEQKARWLGPLGRLDAIGCFALTEPAFGSNPAGMTTRAERVPGGFRIHGHKRWATNGTIAQVAVVWAKWDGKVCGFLIETDRRGFQPRPIHNKWSFRASESSELILENVEVPESALLPGAQSLGAAIACLNQARYSIVWGVVGAAAACIEETLAYLKARPQFDGKPLAGHQLIQHRFAWMTAELTGMQLLAKRLGDLKAAGRLKAAQVSLAKMNNCRKAIEIARACRELLGANGIVNDYHVGRRMLDLETVITYEGTEHIHALVVGQELTGLKAFS
jgi:glutaryl-CoA dehydrogenase